MQNISCFKFKVSFSVIWKSFTSLPIILFILLLLIVMKVFYIFGTIALCLINSAYAQGTYYTKVDPNGNGYGNVVVDTPQ